MSLTSKKKKKPTKFLFITQKRAWKKWSRVIDTLLYLYPTNDQVIQMISIFLTSYKAVLIPDAFSGGAGGEEEGKRGELLGELSLKPLVALALSRDLDDGLKRQSVSLLREVSRNGATQSLKVRFYRYIYVKCVIIFVKLWRNLHEGLKRQFS